MYIKNKHKKALNTKKSLLKKLITDVLFIEKFLKFKKLILFYFTIIGLIVLY